MNSLNETSSDFSNKPQNVITGDRKREIVAKIRHRSWELDVIIGRLQNNSEDINEEMEHIEESDEKARLMELEEKNKRVQEDLGKVYKELVDCMQKMEEADVDFENVYYQLTACRIFLNACSHQLRSSNRIIRNNDKDSIAANPDVQEAISDALDEIESTRGVIEQLQKMIDPTKQISNPSVPNCCDRWYRKEHAYTDFRIRLSGND